jgi:hypothetical protein
MDCRRSGAGPILVVFVFAAVAAGHLSGRWLLKQARGRLAQNERRASAALEMLAAAEADFRSNDRDGNRVADFWVGDVVGLYDHGRLIDSSIAKADARPLHRLVARPIPMSGYLFVAMGFEEGPDPGTMTPYGRDTDGTGRKVHNTSSFGFCAYPAVYGVTGRNTFIINEGNTVARFDTGGTPIVRWPFDSSLKMDWEKID